MPRKICVVVTARPSYSRIKSALRAIQAHNNLELQLVVAASALLERYGKVVDVIRSDGFEPVSEVHMVVEGETPLTSAKTVGLGIVELSNVFNMLKPDAVLSVADRYETLGTAVAGAYMNIPVAHVQGGEITGSIDEKVRHAVTKLADLHLVANEPAAERVRRMGENAASIHVTGCPSIDLAAEIAGRVDDPALHASTQACLARGVGPRLDTSGGYVICMQHPVTYEWESAFDHVTETLEAVARVGVPCYWFWPNADAGADMTSKAIRTFRENNPRAPIHFLKNMPPEEFLFFLRQARCIIGNSSTGLREAAYFGVPCVNIGTRQTGRDRAGNVIDVGHDREEIVNGIGRQLANGAYASSAIYGDGRAGERIARILESSPLETEKQLAY